MKPLLSSIFAIALCSCQSLPIDHLRGMAVYPERSQESMRVSDSLWDKSGHGPYVETSPAAPYVGGDLKGYSPAARTHYTGAAMRKEFKGPNGEPYYLVTREVQWADGTGCWQGCNPPAGYYTSDWRVSVKTPTGEIQ